MGKKSAPIPTSTSQTPVASTEIEITVNSSKPAWIYILRCADGTLYCGSSTDLTRRVREHNTSDR